jgi:signal peptidase I
MLSQFLELPDNPLAIFFIFVIGLLIISLILATWSESWKNGLRSIRLLDSDEDPREFLAWIVGLIIVVRVVQVLVIQPFIVDGSSMLPTFYNNNLLIVDKLSYKIGEAKRGDVIVFRFEKEGSDLDGKYFIKRLIGLPGDTVIVDGTSTSIITPNGTLTPDESFIKYQKKDQYISKQLLADEYFVMGDNRDGSYDSRSWGAVHSNQIAGKVILQIFPVLDVMPGKMSYTKEN